jgi:murein DD-endopeptidase MepM/ murein hydrolase activator NlpD
MGKGDESRQVYRRVFAGCCGLQANERAAFDQRPSGASTAGPTDDFEDRARSTLSAICPLSGSCGALSRARPWVHGTERYTSIMFSTFRCFLAATMFGLGLGCQRTTDVLATNAQAAGDITPPQIVVSAASLRAHQGGTLAPLFRVDEPIREMVAEIDGKALPVFPVFRADGVLLYRGMVGVSVSTVTGEKTLTIQATDLAGNTVSRTLTIHIEETVFEHGGFVRLPSNKKRSMSETVARQAAQANRNAAYAVDISVQLWVGAFARPTAGRRTSSFGKYRAYNTGVRRHHLGVDIGAASGAPVVAANHGVVVLSEFQHTFGNVVIVHHGQGLSTSYNHLSQRLRVIGERVRKGDLVGLVGTTGLSTGPHLHWGMELGGFAVNAEEWQAHCFDGEKVSDFF